MTKTFLDHPLSSVIVIFATLAYTYSTLRDETNIETHRRY